MNTSCKPVRARQIQSASRKRSTIYAAFLLLVSAAPVAHAVVNLPIPASYDIEELPTLNGNVTQATGINNAGRVVGFSFNGAGCCAQAFRFDPVSHTSQFVPYGPITYGQAINSAGKIAGDYDISGGGGGYQAFTFSGAPTQLPLLAGFPWSQGLSINGRDEVAGDAYNPTNRRAFLYSPALGGSIDLGTHGGVNSYARGLNDWKEVVGYYDMGASPDQWRPGRAFYWNRAAQMVDLNDHVTYAPQQLKYELRKATALNNHHQIVGFSGLDLGDIHEVRAFRLDRTGYNPVTQTPRYRFTNLGTFSNGGISYALAVNEGGAAVGGAYLDASGIGNVRAALFAHGQVVNLNERLDFAERLQWRLVEASGINEHGEITGYGINPGGQVRAFKLKPRPHVDVDGTALPGHTHAAALGVDGRAFFAHERVRLELRRIDIGGPLVARGSAIADGLGHVAWGHNPVPCGVDLVVNAWGEASGAFSNTGKINIACQ